MSLTREPELPDEPTMYPPPPPPPPSPPEPSAESSSVIDLRRGRSAGTTRVKIAKHENPYEHLAPDERVKVIIRVLCGLVAYDEDDGDEIIDVSDTAEVRDTADPVHAAPAPVPGQSADPTTV